MRKRRYMILFFGCALLPRPGWGVLVALIFAAQGLALSAHQRIDTTLVTFSPLLLTLGLWLIVVLRRSREFDPRPGTGVNTLSR